MSPFSSQLVIYQRFVTPLDVWYWRKRYPPASVWNDLGSHKLVLLVSYHRTQIVWHRRGRVTFCVSIRRLGAWQIVGILRVGMRTGWSNRSGFQFISIIAHNMQVEGHWLQSAVLRRHCCTSTYCVKYWGAFTLAWSQYTTLYSKWDCSRSNETHGRRCNEDTVSECVKGKWRN